MNDVGMGEEPVRAGRPRLGRRQFLKASGLAAAGTAVAGLPVMAGPFTREDFTRLVPADKKLHPDWVGSLVARGAPVPVRWPESRLVGMPVGGLCCGQLYLGGDGRLWHWDIFNRVHNSGSGGPRYAKPLEPDAPFAQGFALRVVHGGRSDIRALDHTGWAEVDFTGEYPVGRVDYRDDGCPVRVALEAFSPFIPLDEDDSSLPATFMRFTLTNTGTQPVEAAVAGWMENAVARETPCDGTEERVNAIVRGDGFAMLECSARPGPARPAAAARPDVLFDDFERATHEGWTVEGDAFGSGPVSQEQVPAYQGRLGMQGARAVNSHASAPGASVGEKDNAKGVLTSRAFTIERSHIRFLVGGGAHKDATCVELLVDGKTVLSATGRSSNEMAPVTWDVRRWAGREARLRIADRQAGGWGNIGIDHIVFTDAPAEPPPPLARRTDFGTLGLALLGTVAPDRACADLDPAALPGAAFDAPSADGPSAAADPARRAGALGRTVTLPPGGTAEVAFVVAWHFPNLRLAKLEANGGRHYGARFADARAVVAHVAHHADRLTMQTRLWRDTWYGSTLPRWLLDRTFATVSHLATNTCYRFANGRFYGWEGVGCCAGTCTHVWHYAQAVGRLFPVLERSAREMADYGAGFDGATGRIRFRAEHNDHWAVDGQAGSILRTWREHQMSVDDAFLRRVWPRAKKAVEFLLAQDPDADGILEGQQHNTLDADWYGPVAWLSGLHLAALRAAAAMAREMGDAGFAGRCDALADRGRANLAARLFDGEYFINRPDPKHADTINSGTGCHIDQVFGQGWAWQVGLDRVIPQAECLSALRALWRYNFSPDVGVYRNANPPGRWYAMPGEAGLLMCTFPRSDWDYAKAAGRGPGWAAGYFNECMTGFEYQAASHMVAEGLLTEGLAVTRAVHDRYAPQRRNPYNEIECGDHYARAMAGYGVFLAACGFETHGPKGHLGFAPRLAPDDFRCAFTAAGAWGSFAQSRRGGRLGASVEVKWGRLRLRTLALATPAVPASLRATAAGREVAVTFAWKDGRLLLTFPTDATLGAGETLAVDVRV